MSLTKKRKLINYIDTFIEEKKNELVWEKEKHMLRKDADIVLLDVQTKRTEVRKFLNTIQEVENLKKTQVEVLKLRGSRILAEADTFFNNIIATLTQQWAVLDKEYILEEKGLKLMIKTDNQYKISKYSKNISSDWESMLFNKIIYLIDGFDCNLQIYSEYRFTWDQYLEESKGTKVPSGWIIPYGSSSDAWKKHLTSTF